MIEHCYKDAGEAIIASDACETFEKDLVKLLWGEFNFLELLILHKDKYVFVYERMKEEVFHVLTEELRGVSAELSDLLDEIVTYTDVIVVRMKKHCNDLTDHYMSEYKAYAKSPIPAVQKTNITVVQTVNDPNEKYLNINPPPSVRLDTSTKQVFSPHHTNKYMVQEIQKMGKAKLKNMYGGNNHVQVHYDPDYAYENEDNIHKKHQDHTMNNMYVASTENKQVEGHQKNHDPNPYSDSIDFKKKRKLHHVNYNKVKRSRRDGKFAAMNHGRVVHRGNQQYFI